MFLRFCIEKDIVQAIDICRKEPKISSQAKSCELDEKRKDKKRIFQA